MGQVIPLGQAVESESMFALAVGAENLPIPQPTQPDAVVLPLFKVEQQQGEEVEPNTSVECETYAHSLSTLRKVGSLSVAQVVDVEYKMEVENLAFDDFSTAVTEMLKTDKEFGERLEITNMKTHRLVDGKVCARDGQPMVDILQNGANSSAGMAELDPRYEGQATRDKQDVAVAERADKLLPGQTLWGISFAAQKDLKNHPEIYDKKFGYKKNLVYVQTYSMNDDETLTAGSFSFDVTDKKAFMELLAEHDMVIPEDESDNTWLQHAKEISATAQEAHDFVQKMRSQHNERTKKHTKQHSVSEYMEKSGHLLRKFFDAYYLALGEAVYTGKNNDTLQSFAKSVLESNSGLKPEVKQQIITVANSLIITDENGSLLDSVVRYAVVEEMRKGLAVAAPRTINKQQQLIRQSTPQSANLPPSEIRALLVQNIQIGIEAKRSYGGCPGNIDLADDSKPEWQRQLDGDQLNTQEAYGGKDCPEVRDGQTVRCPDCKQMVKAIVPNKQKIYCSNPGCKSAHPDIKE